MQSESKAKTRNPCEMQGSSGPQSAVITVELARLEGFEPPTNGFGSRYSIRLSYKRVGSILPDSSGWREPSALRPQNDE